MPVAKVSPSMLSCDFAYLAAEAKRMEKNGAEWLHLGKVIFACFCVFKIKTDTFIIRCHGWVNALYCHLVYQPLY